MLRFSLLTLFGVVLVAAIGCAALTNPTETWREIILAIAVVALFVAALIAIGRPSPARFAWGFATTGWLYLFATVVMFPGQLPSDLTLNRVFNITHKESLSSHGYITLPPDFAGNWSDWNELKSNSIQISRYSLTLLLALIGGLFVSWLGRRREIVEPP